MIMDVEFFLECALKLEEEIKEKENIASAYKQSAERCTPSYSADVVKSSPNENGKIPYAVEKLLLIDKKIKRLREELSVVRDEISNAIALIDDEEIEAVMVFRYLEYKTWKDIAKDLRISERTVYRLRNEGIDILGEKLAVSGS